MFRKFKSNTLGGLLVHVALACFILFVLFWMYFYVYLPKVTNHGETITVPNVEGLPMAQAEKELVRRTLRYEVNDSLYSADYPPLAVVKQYPHPGAKVKEGRKIFVSINRVKPPSVPVPNLVDGSVVNADAVLRSNELKRGKIILVPGPFNMVKEMRYKGEKIAPLTRVPKGSVIDLVVMDGGSNEWSVQDFTGYTFEEVKFVLLGQNLNLGKVILLRDTTGAEAVVVKQKPAEGQNIRVGDAVDLWIGKPEDLQKRDDEEDF
jgi:eukaryotic-like serine/threonine-protein kinase